MKHYIDITLLPSDGIGIHFLWSKLMVQVHLAFVEIQDANKQVPIAVSFPQYKEKLEGSSAFIGHKLRLLAINESDLVKLDIDKWLNRLEDYVHIKKLSKVPDEIAHYENFNRRRKLGNPESLIKRRMKRHSETREQASKHFEGYKMKEEDKALPFIQMKSLESNNHFNMSITRKQVQKSECHVMFNTYGFNGRSVLPHF